MTRTKNINRSSTMQQCIAIKGVGVSRNSTRMMIKNWKTQGLIYSKDKYYVKIVEQIKDA